MPIVGDLVYEDGQRFEGSIDPNGFVNENGQDAKIDTSKPAVWEVTGDVARPVEHDGDGLTNLRVRSPGDMPPESADRGGQVKCTVDADLGDGFAPLDLIWNLTLKAKKGLPAVGMKTNPFGAPVADV
jgi:hypothetical protein